MKNLTISVYFYFFFVFLPVVADETSSKLNTLDELQWEQRIILLRDTGLGMEWLRQLEEAKAEIVDRDIYWFLLNGKTLSSNADLTWGMAFVEDVESVFSDRPETLVILIGKDGGVKATSLTLDLSSIFALVDSMSMRRAEIRERQGLEK